MNFFAFISFTEWVFDGVIMIGMLLVVIKFCVFIYLTTR